MDSRSRGEYFRRSCRRTTEPGRNFLITLPEHLATAAATLSSGRLSLMMTVSRLLTLQPTAVCPVFFKALAISGLVTPNGGRKYREDELLTEGRPSRAALTAESQARISETMTGTPERGKREE